MFNPSVSLANAALRAGPLGGVRAVQPVVARAPQDAPADARTPVGTRYTPQPALDGAAPYYARNGASARSLGVFTASVARSDTFDLEVRTAEGDVATLRFAQSSSASIDVTSIATAGKALRSAADLQIDTAQSSGLQVDIQGSLNDGERAAINALAEQVGAVAEDFFAGNTDAALRGANRIDISNQAQTLTAYDFTLESRSTQVAAAIYDDVARTTAPLNAQVPQKDRTNPAGAPPLPTPKAENDDGGTNGLLKRLLDLFDALTANAPTDTTSTAPVSA